MSIDDIFSNAKKMSYGAIALTDYRVMYGALEFFKKSKKYEIKAVFGLEVDVEDYRVVLYAKNNEGMKMLHRLSYKLSFVESLDLSDLTELSEDVVIVFPSEKGPFEKYLYEKDTHLLEKTVLALKLQFDVFFIGMTHQESKFFLHANEKLEAIAKQYQISCIAMPKIYYQDLEDHDAFSALRAIGEGKNLKQEDVSLMQAPERHFLSLDEYKNLYKKEWIENAETLVDTCHVDLLKLKTHLPQFNNGRDVDNNTFIKALSYTGMKKRLQVENLPTSYMKRLDYELDVIIKMGFVNYFLIVYDVIRFAKVKGINVGPGRGSSAGSLVSYALGITDVDPLEYNLMFERFLNPERQSMPDIDIDFPDNRRDEVVKYAFNKYGYDHVAHIAAFGNLRARQSFVDCARILNVPNYKAKRALDLIERDLTLMQNFNKNKRFALLLERETDLRQVFELALKIEGKPRHVSQHAAGIVMSDKPLLDVIPVTVNKEQSYLSQYDMNDIEDLGLIKIDFLGIKNLTVIDSIVSQVREENPDFSITKIPLDDVLTYQLISSGDTIGIFQLESEGMKELLRQLKPQRFLDIVDTIALYRPGPMENIPSYLSNRSQPDKINYYHDSLKEITQDTYGILIYQEQIMQVAQKFAGFTLAQADILRRAMSSKDAKVLASLEASFKQGAHQKGYDDKLITFIYDLIYKFANYGFNKSHSVAYSLVAYQLSYLKAHYPTLFYQELLNSVIGDSVRTKLYLDESLSRKVEMEVPSINTSLENYSIHEGMIRLPLSIIKNISRTTASLIVKNRQEHGVYRSYVDAVVRLNHLKLTDKHLEALIHAGTFDIFNLSRETMLENLQEVKQYASLITIKDSLGNTVFNYALVSEPKLKLVNENRKASLENEYKSFGFYLREYPTTIYKNQHQTDSIYQLKIRNESYRIIVKLDYIKVHVAKDGNEMAFLKVSDDSGSMDAIMFHRIYSRFKEKLHVNDIVLIKGQVQEEGKIIIRDFHIIES